jgi:Ras-related protein Rab-28
MSVTCKIVLLGNGSVGKSSLIQRIVQDGFEKVYKQTKGVDFFTKEIELKGKTTVLQVWDIGGQSFSSKMLDKYIFGCSSVLFTYDITDLQSFRDLDDWRMKVEAVLRSSKAGRSERPNLFLVGNKIDLAHLRKVSEARHKAFVRSHKLDEGFFVSAKSGDQVLTLIYKVAARTAGVELSAYELEFTKRALGVTVAADDADDDARTTYADEIAAQDAKLEARRRRKENGSCCAIS